MAAHEQVVMDADAIARSIRRVALEIVEQTRGTPHLGLVGIRRGGVPIANRIAAEIATAESRHVPVGAVDFTLYRDDAASTLPDTRIGPSEIDFEINGWDVVLVDDVLHTGRTVRAAIDCLLDYGRPRRVWLAVLCDRNGRQLPIAPDFVGQVLHVAEGSVLDVCADGGEGDRALIRSAGDEG
ncbi:MAG: bifunctional pyr operon transcriptional regulator/uracil phosphoribosyltransferase PyrR [Polyangiales bacterium]